LESQLVSGSSESYHEPFDALSPEIRDLHRALTSVQEELEAVDWYRQRAEVCKDPALRAILLHNMREEVEHASMLIEWLRRHNPDFAEHLGDYLFTEGSITAAEATHTDSDAGDHGAEGEDTGGSEARDTAPSIGSLKS
jgi:ferritin-like protein